MNPTRLHVSIMVGVMLTAAPVWAQEAPSGITGLVRDTSGAVLPGVTVEAASPALIERVRTAITDSEGRYNIVDLPYVTGSHVFKTGIYIEEGIASKEGSRSSICA